MKKVFVLSFFTVGLLLLFACSSGTNNDTPEAPPVSQEKQEAPKAPVAEPPDVAAEEQIDDEPEVSDFVSGEVVISFEYTKQSGSASNQYAVWIEDKSGRLIKTLYASRWTANGGYKTRPDSIALWAEKSDLAGMSKSEVDAVAGATPKSGPQSYTWDLTGPDGELVPKGDYVFFVEGTLRWKNYVLFSEIIMVGDGPVTTLGDSFYHYEGGGRYDELTPESTENNMIAAVTASFIPSADS